MPAVEGASVLDGQVPGTASLAVVAEEWAAHLAVAAHRHPCIQVMSLVTGLVQVTTPRNSWMLPPNLALVIPMDLEHRVESRGRSRVRVVYLDAGLYPEMGPICEMIEVSPILRDVLERLSGADQPAEPSGPTGRLVAVVMDELRLAPRFPVRLPRPQDQRLEPMYETLLRDPGDPTTLEEWAAEFGWSTRTLSRAFQDDLGTTFRQYRQQAKVVAAVSMLASGLSQSQVALRVGYNSAGALAEAFKDLTGAPPGAFQHSPPLA